MNRSGLLSLVLVLTGCTHAPPELTGEEKELVDSIEVYRSGEKLPGKYVAHDTIKLSSCAGTDDGGRIFGEHKDTIELLKRKAAEVEGANAVVEVVCSRGLGGTCWWYSKCRGTIATLTKDPIEGPFY